MIVFHKVGCSNSTWARHFKHWGYWRVYPVINFKVPKSVEGRASRPGHLVIKQKQKKKDLLDRVAVHINQEIDSAEVGKCMWAARVSIILWFLAPTRLFKTLYWFSHPHTFTRFQQCGARETFFYMYLYIYSNVFYKNWGWCCARCANPNRWSWQSTVQIAERLNGWDYPQHRAIRTVDYQNQRSGCAQNCVVPGLVL